MKLSSKYTYILYSDVCAFKSDLVIIERSGIGYNIESLNDVIHTKTHSTRIVCLDMYTSYKQIQTPPIMWAIVCKLKKHYDYVFINDSARIKFCECNMHVN